MKQRIEYIDLAKGLCILLVLFHHTALFDGDLDYPLKNMMKMFRMPLYFMLSGLFFKKYNGFVEFCKKKTNKLLIPYIVFHLVGFLLPHGNGAIWFLLCLFIVNILFYTIYLTTSKVEAKKGVVALCLTCMAAGVFSYWLSRRGIIIEPYVTTALAALPFYAMGYVLRKYTDILNTSKYDKYGVLLAIPLFVITHFLSGYVNYRNNVYDVSIFSMYVGGFTGIMGILLIAKAFVKLPIISYCGRFSVIILLTHVPILHFVEPHIIKALRGIHIPELSIVMATTAMLTVAYLAIIPLMKRYFPYVTAQKDLLR